MLTSVDGHLTQWGGRNDGRRDDGFWEVERIIKVRKQGSRREYFVEWTGWEAKYNSWTKDVSKVGCSGMACIRAPALPPVVRWDKGAPVLPEERASHAQYSQYTIQYA